MLELLLDALDAIEADVDEHETANYNVYFPPTDEDEPTYDALHSYREHWRGLVARLRKRETLRVDEFEPPE